MKNNKEDSILNVKSYSFAIRIVKLSQMLQQEQKEFTLSKQILRSGTAIGALIRESEFGQSKTDFAHKLSIALKEANETEYWLCLLRDTNYLNERLSESLLNDCRELISLLIASKTVKKNITS